MNNTEKAAVGVAVGAAVAGAVALKLSTISLRVATVRAPSTANYTALVERWSTTVREVKYPPAFVIPENAREIPLVGLARTPFGRRPGRDGSDHTTRDGAIYYLEAVRGLLDSAGRNDEDARCAGLLLAIESAWGKTVWNYNIGNVKSQGTVYARSRDELLRTRRVFCTNYEAVGIHLLVDGLRSLDGYPAYTGHDVFMRKQKTLFERTYRGVLEGYRAGGLDGLLAAENILGGGRGGPRYSSEGALSRLATARVYWANMRRRIGPRFDERF